MPLEVASGRESMRCCASQPLMSLPVPSLMSGDDAGAPEPAVVAVVPERRDRQML